MEAPEKIYIFENPISGTPDDRWLSKRSCNDDIEYTRTDAFIEKACEFLNDRIKHDSIDYPMATVHLIDDFKNYMKEV